VKEKVSRIRLLYACHHFAKEVGSTIRDESRRNGAHKKSVAYLLAATAEVTLIDSPEPVDTRLAKAFSEVGRGDFMAFMDKVVSLKDDNERGTVMSQFASKCDSAVGATK